MAELYTVLDGMRVGIDARELWGRPAGKGRYLARILEEWQNDPAIHLVLYIKPGQKVPFSGSNIEVISVGGKGSFWHLMVSRRLKRDRVRVFLAGLSYQSALFNTVPTLTIVHDLAVFQRQGYSHNWKAQLVERRTLRFTVRRSRQIVAISTSTKRDLLSFTSVHPRKVAVVGGASFLDTKSTKPLPRSERKAYILYTGTLEPRKNITSILRAFALMPDVIRELYTLKLVGKPGWGGEDYPALASQLAISHQVEFLGYVSDRELDRLYREASLFVYPSWYEGFGLPVVEAMAAGTPVVTSNTSSLPEVAGEAALMCDPASPPAIAEAMTSILSDTQQWDQLSAASLKQCKLFQWDEVAQQFKELLFNMAA